MEMLGSLMIGLTEPGTTSVVLVVFGVIMAFSALFSRTVTQLGIPVVLVFLILGMLGGSEGIGGIAFSDYEFAFRVGTIALILILFDGGMNTSLSSVRQSAAPAGLLATVGVVLTAVIVGLIGRLLGLGWGEAFLIGAIVSSTDAAAVFAVLRGGMLSVRRRVRSTIEVESCVNDPMAVVLTVGLIEIIASGGRVSWDLLWSVPVQLIVGAAAGLLIGWLTAFCIARIRLSTVGLYPVVTMSSAFLSFGVATLLGGSGFLAVFAAALVVGRSYLPYRAGLVRVHDAVAWLSQVCMFVMLGLLVFPSRLVEVAWVGLGLAVALVLIARPLAVAACLLPLRWSGRETGYVGWVGIRGAVPIILATFPSLAGMEGADRIFHIVFFVVAMSSIVPGATILWLTRRMGMFEPSAPTARASIEMHSLNKTNGNIYMYYIDESLAVCGATLSQIPFPEGASVVLVVRGDDVLPARGKTEIRSGDFVYVLCRAEDEARVGLLLGRSSMA